MQVADMVFHGGSAKK